MSSADHLHCYHSLLTSMWSKLYAGRGVPFDLASCRRLKLEVLDPPWQSCLQWPNLSPPPRSSQYQQERFGSRLCLESHSRKVNRRRPQVQIAANLRVSLSDTIALANRKSRLVALLASTRTVNSHISNRMLNLTSPGFAV